jgi:hypothetical protein
MSVGGVAAAQSCVLPVPFQYEFQSRAAMTLSAAVAGDPCSLGVALSAGAGPTASGFLHYRRAVPVSTARYGFRLDTGALTNLNNLQGAQIFAAVSPAIAGSPRSADLLQINVSGSNLQFIAAGTAQQVALVPLTQSVNTVRVEITVGSGTAGAVRYWINHAFSDPPDGVLDHSGAGLDNAAWSGVLGAELGLSSASNPFRANQATHVVTFDQIESSDDVLFWSGFFDDAQHQEAP